MTSAACKILIADDDDYVQEDILDLLKDTGHELLSARTAKETWEQIKRHTPDLVLLDIKFPDSQDFSLLKRIKQEAGGTEVIIISSQRDNVAQIVEAIKIGAFDYVPKPFVPAELINRVNKALSLRELGRAQEMLVGELQKREGIDALIGESPVMRQVREMIRKLAETDVCVLICGESGTGKELAARALHYFSKRRANPFVAVNCAAIPETLIESTLFGHKRGAFTGAVDSSKGKFEFAGNGTIFLDEIGDMPYAQQPSLLRVLEYRKFSSVGESEEKQCKARFVLATNRDLRECVTQGTFREDLFYRVNVACISMPSLRARLEDIPVIADYYCDRLSAEMGRPPIRLHPEVVALFREYDWPGNVRELRNVIEAAVMLGDSKQAEITTRDLPADLLSQRQSGAKSEPEISVQERREKQDLIRALQQAYGNQTVAAKLLNVHRNTVRARIRYYGIVTSPQDA